MDQEESLTQDISSTFRLQLNELQVERSPHQFVEDKSETFARKIETLIRKAKVKHTFPLDNISAWDKFGITFPLTHIQQLIRNSGPNDASYTWFPCQELFTMKAEVVSGKLVKKAFLTIPENVFGERSFLNLQYPLRRAHYICSCITILKKMLKDVDISFVPGAHGDLLFPNILISGEDVSVHLIFSGEKLAKPVRFGITQGNFRTSVLSGNSGAKDFVTTPRYNQRVLRTMLELSLMKEIQSSILDQPNLREAWNLLKAWFQSRDIPVFDDLFLLSFMLHLLDSSKITALHQSWYIFKNVLFALEEWNTNAAVSLQEGDNKDCDRLEFLKVFDIVLLDRTGTWNIASDISFDDLNKAKSLMITCIPYVGDYHHFEKLFKTNEGFYSAYDEYFKLYLSSSVFEKIINDHVEDVVDWKDRLSAFIRAFEKVVRGAMGERYEYCRCEMDYTNDSWELQENKSTMPVDMSLILGFKIKKEWKNPLTVGPIANNPSAKEFRSFWGKKSELRKFADTRICECVVWSEESSNDICFDILKFVLQEKFAIPANHLSWRSEVPSSLRSDKAAYDKLGVAYASLNKLLRSLKSLPLEITNISGVSPYLRYAEPMGSQMISSQCGKAEENARYPERNYFIKYAPTLEVHVRMTYSSQWGNEIDLVKNLTTAFHVKMAESIRELKYVAVATEEAFLVVLDDIVFKICIVNDRIKLILNRQKKSLISRSAPRGETSEINRSLKTLEIKYLDEPSLSSSIYAFSMRFTVFSDTVQMTKLWLASHLLSSFVNDFVIELIVCAAIKDSGYNTPESPFAAFRKVLHLLATHPWISSPLIVDLDGTWKEEYIGELEQDFLKFRPVLPPMVIMTNQDTTGTKWTHCGPNPVILNRITALARICYEELEKSMLSVNKLDLQKSLFDPSTSSYDAVVHFHKKAVTRKIKTGANDNRKFLPVVDFDPFYSFAMDLRTLLEPVALVFFNKYGGESIYLKFKPHQENQKFAVAKCAFKTLADDCLVLNKDEIFETIKIIGKNLVREIQVLN